MRLLSISVRTKKGSEISVHALNYFMGILRRGPHTPPSNNETPHARQMRLYLLPYNLLGKERFDRGRKVFRCGASRPSSPPSANAPRTGPNNRCRCDWRCR